MEQGPVCLRWCSRATPGGGAGLEVEVGGTPSTREDAHGCTRQVRGGCTFYTLKYFSKRSFGDPKIRKGNLASWFSAVGKTAASAPLCWS